MSTNPGLYFSGGSKCGAKYPNKLPNNIEIVIDIFAFTFLVYSINP